MLVWPRVLPHLINPVGLASCPVVTRVLVIQQSAEGAAAGASQAGDPVSSTPGSDLARRVDANITALQVLLPTTRAARKPDFQASNMLRIHAAA
jgi:hypothetical protein